MKRLVLFLLVVALFFKCVDESNAKDLKPRNEIWVMVIDTGIGTHSKLGPNVQYDQSIDYIDNNDHGTHVAGIVLYGNHINGPETVNFDDKLCPNVKIISCKYYDAKSLINDNLEASVECVKRATKMKIDFINYSGGGSDYNEEEYKAYKEFSDSGGIIYTAAGNEGKSLKKSPYYPASYAFLKKNPIKNMIVVENVDRDGKLVPSSNWHLKAIKSLGHNVLSTLPNDKFGYMTGTSQSTPGALHTKLKHLCEQFN